MHCKPLVFLLVFVRVAELEYLTSQLQPGVSLAWKSLLCRCTWLCPLHHPGQWATEQRTCTERLLYAFMQPVRWAYFLDARLNCFYGIQYSAREITARLDNRTTFTDGRQQQEILLDVWWRHHHSSASVEGHWQRMYLTRDCQGVAQLCLPCPELSKHLCDRARLNPTWQGNGVNGVTITEDKRTTVLTLWCRVANP